MSVDTPVSTEAAASAARRSLARRLLRDPQAVGAGGILLAMLALAMLAPAISPFDPNLANLSVARSPVGTPGYPLGTDASGRDVLSRLLASLMTSFVSGAIGAGIAGVVGVTFGLIGGYFGPAVRGATEWLFNVIMTFPGVLLLIVLMPVTNGDFRLTMVIFGFLLSPSIYRIVRNMVLGVRNELFVDAARVSGLSTSRILSRHILFVVRGPVVISLAFMFGGAIGVQSGLAFLGIGSNSVPSFGSMMGEAFVNLSSAPGNFLWPALSLGLLTASLVLFGNALRDAFGAVRPKAAKLEQRSRVTTPSRLSVGSSSSVVGATPVLRIADLAIAYPSEGGLREVVHEVNLVLQRGEILGLVGESGSGKTQTAFAALGVLPPEAVVVSGSITLEGNEIVGKAEREMRSVRGRDVAYIPQEPMSNLDPSYTVGAQLVESLRSSSGLPRVEVKQRVLELLARVGIADPARTFRSYPHEISGGMAQRVLIAGAVAGRPKLLIADEPTTALDVTVQADILDLLRDLQAETGMAVLLVTHNFGVVADLCDRIAVMKQGRIVEVGTTRGVLSDPQDGYTRMLLESMLDERIVREDLPASYTADSEGTTT